MTRRSTPRLVVAVLAAAAGALVAIMSGRADAAVLAAPWVVLLALGLSRAGQRSIVASVSVSPDRVLVGDRITVRTRIANAAGWVHVRSRPESTFDRWPHDPSPNTKPGIESDSDSDSDLDSEPDSQPDDESDAPVDTPSVADVVGPAGTAELECSLTTSAWGTHDVGQIDLVVNEPYGLLRWSGSLHTPSPVRVHPLPNQLDDLLAPWLVRRLAGAHESTAVGNGVEFADLRPFGAGDSPRDINWRATARTGELWTAQRHPDQSTEVVLLLDTFIESGHEIRAVLGLAIEAAIALAESHLAATDRVGLIELGGIVRWVSPRTGRLQLQRLVDALLATRLYENSAERDLSIVPSRGLPPRSFVVALTPLVDERFIHSLFTLRASGHDVSVIECPPVTDDEPRPDRTEAHPVARKLWYAERDLTIDRLAGQGVAVARWDPGDRVQQVVAELTRRRRGTRTARRP